MRWSRSLEYVLEEGADSRRDNLPGMCPPGYDRHNALEVSMHPALPPLARLRRTGLYPGRPRLAAVARTAGSILAACLVVGWSADSALAQSYEDAVGDITLALTGDAIITRALSPYEEPHFLTLREMVAGATAAFTNLEVLFHDYEEDVIPAAVSGGTYMRAEPKLARELAWFGFDLVSRANNHSMDFGVGGMRRTTRAVEAAGLVHAGVGENLALARAPAYLETPGGRIALISIASTFDGAMRAGPQRKDMRGRPGLSPLRFSRSFILPEDRFTALIDIMRTFRPGLADDADSFSFGGTRFVRGDEVGQETSANPDDLAQIVQTVRDAKRQADFVLVTSHTHESSGRREIPADFLVETAHAVIEAGADVFAGHGPHVLRGIEIYRGKPIFYSLGNFIFQNETVELQPADNYEGYDLPPDALPGEFQDRRIERSRGGGFPGDPAYWEGLLALTEFSGGELTAIRLYPVTLGHGLDRPQRGRPLLALGEHGRAILDGLAALSEPFGTTITQERGMGVIRP
jgi:poly-gamma-glutamate synthesis protein (capsule biosynthesis protein)